MAILVQLKTTGETPRELGRSCVPLGGNPTCRRDSRALLRPPGHPGGDPSFEYRRPNRTSLLQSQSVRYATASCYAANSAGGVIWPSAGIASRGDWIVCVRELLGSWIVPLQTKSGLPAMAYHLRGTTTRTGLSPAEPAEQRSIKFRPPWTVLVALVTLASIYPPPSTEGWRFQAEIPLMVYQARNHREPRCTPGVLLIIVNVPR